MIGASPAQIDVSGVKHHTRVGYWQAFPGESKTKATRVEHQKDVLPWPNPQTLEKHGMACQGQTLQLITNILKLR